MLINDGEISGDLRCYLCLIYLAGVVFCFLNVHLMLGSLAHFGYSVDDFLALSSAFHCSMPLFSRSHLPSFENLRMESCSSFLSDVKFFRFLWCF